MARRAVPRAALLTADRVGYGPWLHSTGPHLSHLVRGPNRGPDSTAALARHVSTRRTVEARRYPVRAVAVFAFQISTVPDPSLCSATSWQSRAAIWLTWAQRSKVTATIAAP